MIINKSAFVFFNQKKIFQLVDDVEHYPDFLPWCGGSKVIKRTEEITEATIEINFKGVKQSFTTRNVKKPFEVMEINLVDGPFKKLTGLWKFADIDKNSCKIELSLIYEFDNLILEKLIGPIFNIIANTFIDEFIKEANKRFNE